MPKIVLLRAFDIHPKFFKHYRSMSGGISNVKVEASCPTPSPLWENSVHVWSQLFGERGPSHCPLGGFDVLCLGRSLLSILFCFCRIICLSQGVELGSSAAQPGRCCVLDYARIWGGERAAAGPVCSGSLLGSPLFLPTSAHCVLSSAVVEAGGKMGETHGHRWHPRRLAEPVIDDG